MNKNIIKFTGLIFFIILFFVLAKIFNLGYRISEMKTWIQHLGYAGPFVFIIIYAMAVIFAVPGSAMTILAGVLFGTLIGTIVVSIASTIGAALAFLIARYFARGFIEEKLGKNGKFAELDRLAKENGEMVVAITRLIPLFPFNFLNYAFGMTGVKFGTYVLWSWLCMLPFTIVYVAGADALITGIKEGKIPWPVISVLIVAVIIMVFAIKKASSKLKNKDG
jgi:uncharacterized membrane protein YdjX (TVP38/TMEM64 family)